MARLVIEVGQGAQAKSTIEAVNTALGKLGGSAKILNGDLKGLERQNASVERRFRSLAGSLDPTIRLTNQYERAQKLLQRSLQQGIVSQKEHDRLLGLARGKYLEASQGANAFSSSLSKMSGLVGGLSFALLARELVTTIAGFEQLRARLETVTGSTQAAGAAFDLITEFAKTTPFSVQEITDSFVRMSSQGIVPTEAVLRSFGNTAAAMGRDFNQFTEAVLDAATGEFERLKEFGIKARSQGNQVTFTFKEMSTTVAKESGAIVGYLKKIGETDFAGAMERQSKTLAGQFSNLGDNVSQLADALGTAGLTGVMAQALEAANNLVGGLTSLAQVLGTSIPEGGVKTFLSTLLEKASVLGMISSGINDIADAVKNLSDGQDDGGKSASKWNELLAAAIVAIEERFRDLNSAYVVSEQGMDRATESMFKQTERADELAKKLEAVLGVALPLHSETKKIAEQQAVLAHAFATGAIDAKTYAVALATIDEELKKIASRDSIELPSFQLDIEDFLPDAVIQSTAERFQEAMTVALDQSFEDSLAEIGDQLDAALVSDDSVAKMNRSFEETKKSSEAIAKEWRDISGLLASLAPAFDRIDARLGQLVASAAAFADAMAQVAENAGAAQTAMAGAQAGAAIYGMGQSLGIWDAGGGTSSFGGQMSGNYADVGSVIGAAIGAVITSESGGWGALIGGVIGGALGSAIKKGADEGIVHLEQVGDQIVQKLIASDGGLGRYARDAGTAIASGVTAALDILGGRLAQLPDIGLKIRDEMVSVTVGVVKAKFESLDEAIAFAVAESLKQGGVEGIARELQDVLQGFQGSDLGELTGALDLVQSLMDTAAGFSALESQMRQLPNTIEALRHHLEQLGLTAADAERLAGAALVDQMQNMRDQITGHQRTAAEERAERERQAAMFNAQRLLTIAELELRKQELIQKAALLRSHGEMVQADTTVQQAFINARGQLLELEGDLMRKELGLKQDWVRVSADLLQAQAALLDQQIAAIDQILANMPKEINLGEIKIGGGGKAKGGGVGKGFKPTEQLPTPEEARELVAQYLRTGFEQSLAEIRKWAEEQRQLYIKLGLAVEEVNAAEQARLEMLGEQALGALGSATVDTMQRFDQLREALDFLQANAADLGISIEQLGEITAEVGYSMGLSLVDSLLQYVDNEDVRRQLEQARYEIEIANIQLQFYLLQELGLLTEEMIALIQGLIDDLPDEAPSLGAPAAPSGGGYSGGGGGYLGDDGDAAMEALTRALERLADYYDQLLQDESVSPLSLQDRFGLAEDSYNDLLAQIAAAQASGDVELLAQLYEELPGVAQQYLELAAQMFGTSTQAYQDIFQAVLDTIEGYLGGYQEPNQWQWLQGDMDHVRLRLGNINYEAEQQNVWLSNIRDILVSGGGAAGATGTSGATSQASGIPAGGLHSPSSGTSNVLFFPSSPAASVNVDVSGLAREVESLRRDLTKAIDNLTRAQDSAADRRVRAGAGGRR